MLSERLPGRLLMQRITGPVEKAAIWTKVGYMLSTKSPAMSRRSNGSTRREVGGGATLDLMLMARAARRKGDLL